MGFGERITSFEQLLRESIYCLILPGDVSDLAMRFFHAVSVGCTPVVVGGPEQAISLPFPELVEYRRFARFATVRNVDDAVAMLQGLMAEEPGSLNQELTPHRLEDILGLFMQHEECGVPSGDPFVELLA